MENISKIDSLIILAESILNTAALDEHKVALLNSCLWIATVINGKYNAPYWSQGIYALVQAHGGKLKSVLKLRPSIVRHEHVNTRKSLIEKMMKDPSCVEKVLREDAFACLVTKDEHPLLKDNSEGFDRYKAAKIRVWDVQNEKWHIAD